MSLVAAGCGEAVLSAAVTEELGLFLGSCAEEMESEVQTWKNNSKRQHDQLSKASYVPILVQPKGDNVLFQTPS